MFSEQNYGVVERFDSGKSSLPATGFLACGGGGGGICWRFVEALGEDPLCRLSQVLLRLRNVTGESPDPVPPPPAYDGGLLRDFFSGVRHPFYKRNKYLWIQMTCRYKSVKYRCMFMLIYSPYLLLSFRHRRNRWNLHREKDSSQYWHYQTTFSVSGERDWAESNSLTFFYATLESIRICFMHILIE